MKVLIWVITVDIKFLDSAIKILEQQNYGTEIIGVTAAKEVLLQRDGRKIKFITFSEVKWINFNILLVVGAGKLRMGRITQFARQLNFPEEKLLCDWIVRLPGFTLEKYRRLQRSHLSIFSMNCFGGLISGMVGLPFLSPLIDMFFKERDYLRFLSSPRVYMEKELVLKEIRYDNIVKINYPVVTLSDFDIHMNHYKTFEAAVDKWNERKQRINWYNLFVMAYTDNKDFLEQFDALPYGKKVCFVSFKSDLDSAWYINPEIDFDRMEEGFHDVVNNFSRGKYIYYDPFDMLLYGKKTPLIDM
ncbi:MAG: DUF1919 domain-containing protein [Selenomonadaceae bacterium]|nr:DUF1919 domain-containing protein [Selenomonadaceae bacterium]